MAGSSKNSQGRAKNFDSGIKTGDGGIHDRKEVSMDYRITSYVQHFIKEHVKPGDYCIDATAGNGHDTLFLCQLIGETGKVLAFDIQESALECTKRRLEDNGCQAQLILDSHANMRSYAAENTVDCIVFNFGYLPGGDHNLATQAWSSIQAMEAGLCVLKKGGIMTLCIYSGGDSGFTERDALLTYLKELDAKKYLVIASFYYNRPNHPPIPVIIQKL